MLIVILILVRNSCNLCDSVDDGCSESKYVCRKYECMIRVVIDLSGLLRRREIRDCLHTNSVGTSISVSVYAT